MKTYKISEFAKAIGVTRQTLINWEKLGKLKPDSKGKNGYRIYTQRQLDEFLGINLSIQGDKKNENEKIIDILEKENKFLKEQIRTKDEIIKREQELRLMADKKILLLENKETPKMEIDNQTTGLKKWWQKIF